MPDVIAALRNAGVEIEPLIQDGSDVVLNWSTADTGPILDDEQIVVLPDMHLGGGANGDIFRGTSASANGDRFLRFVTALDSVKPSFPGLSVVQLGDLYDVWRAYPDYRDHPTSDYRVIEDAYGKALRHLVQGNLRARVCVGNHDASLALFPPSWARVPGGVTDQLAYGHYFGSGRVIALHGHQEQTLADAMQAQGGSGAVKLATEIAKLSNSLSQLIQQGVDILGDLFADSESALNDILSSRWPGADPPADAHGFTATRWCDRDGRDVLQRLFTALPNAAALRLVIVGHSHRPGISAIHIDGRLVPMVDFGSWVWGRAQFGVASEGELKLWTIA